MKFNDTKSRTWDKTKPLQQHNLGTDCLHNSSAEKDLSILMDKLKMNQTRSLMTKSIDTLGYASQTAASRLREVIISIESALMRSHFEQHVQIWAPPYETDTDKLE